MKSRSAEQLAEVHDLWALVLEKQKAAKALRDLELFNDCLSRAYYSAFHAVTLLFFLRGQAFDSHKQLLGQFNKLFVHGGSFPASTARNLETLFSYRQSGDYDAHIKFDLSEAEKGLAQAQEILDTVRKHLVESEGIKLA